MKSAKVVGACILVLQLLGIAAFALSAHTVFSVLMNVMPGGALALELRVNESTGVGVLTLNANPRNDGFLGVDLSIEVGVLDNYERYIARNSTTVYLDAGEQQPFSLSLIIPADEVQKNILEEGFLEFAIRVRTLRDLVGFSNTLRVQGGGRGG